MSGDFKYKRALEGCGSRIKTHLGVTSMQLNGKVSNPSLLSMKANKTVVRTTKLLFKNTLKLRTSFNILVKLYLYYYLIALPVAATNPDPTSISAKTLVTTSLQINYI